MEEREAAAVPAKIIIVGVGGFQAQHIGVAPEARAPHYKSNIVLDVEVRSQQPSTRGRLPRLVHHVVVAVENEERAFGAAVSLEKRVVDVRQRYAPARASRGVPDVCAWEMQG